MVLTARQSELFEFVKAYHGDQLRKYTNVPYWNHLLSVADIVTQYDNSFGIVEIALCHDLFEDTECNWDNLVECLYGNNGLGYTDEESQWIADGVNHLSDKYTKECYPELNRKTRKIMEADRLSQIPSHCQSVKYADLIDNSDSIVGYDEGFAKVFLAEKRVILQGMKNGNPDLYIDCCYVLRKSELSIQSVII